MKRERLRLRTARAARLTRQRRLLGTLRRRARAVACATFRCDGSQATGEPRAARETASLHVLEDVVGDAVVHALLVVEVLACAVRVRLALDARGTVGVGDVEDGALRLALLLHAAPRVDNRLLLVGHGSPAAPQAGRSLYLRPNCELF
jgi:hypothetical protein